MGMRQRLLRLFAAGFLCLLTTQLAAENWPRFRGPNGSGVSSESGFPVSWTAEDYAWVIDIPGISHSSPVIWNERIFLATGLEEGTIRRLVCLDTTSGQTKWQADLSLNTVHLHLKNSFTSGSPVVNEKYVVAAFADEAQFIVGCWNHEGKEQWRQNLGEFLSEHGPSCSPIIYGNLVIVPKDMKGPSAVFGIDLQTGNIVWKRDREFRRTSYATPLVRTRADGKTEVICVSGMTGITGLDVYTGETLWKSPEFPMRTVGSPVLTDTSVLATCGSGGSGKQMQVVSLNGMGEVVPRLTITQKIPYVPTPVYRNGYLFMILDGGIATCIDSESGEEVWLERIDGKVTGSPVWVEGRLYVINEDGTVVVLSADQNFSQLGRVPLGELCYSTPAVANGRMYFKTASKLFCLPAKSP